jgi:hypothetical protein
LTLTEKALFLLLKNRVFYFIFSSWPGSGPERKIVTLQSFEMVSSEGHGGPGGFFVVLF